MMIVAVGQPAGCIGAGMANPICQGVSGIGSAIFGTGASAALDAMSGWVSNGAVWLLGQIGSALSASTAVNLATPWFVVRYQAVEALLGAVALPMLLATAIHALVRQSPVLLLRAALVQLPLGMVLAGAAVELTTITLGIVDELCRAVSGATPDALHSLTSSLARVLVSESASGGPATPSFVVMLGALLVAAVGLLLWVEMVLRSAAIYVAVAFLPLALVAMVWPALASWSRRLAETLFALIVSKFVVVVVLDMAVGALGTARGRGFSTIITGLALLALATLAPFTLMKLVPMVEASAAGHFEGLRHRATRSLSSSTPRRMVDLAIERGSRTPPLAVPAALASAGARGMGGSGRGDQESARGSDGLGVERSEDPMTSSAVQRGSALSKNQSSRSPLRPEQPRASGSSGQGDTSSVAPAAGRTARTPTRSSSGSTPVRWPGPTAEGPAQPGERTDIASRPSADETPQEHRSRWPRRPSLVIETDALGPRIAMAPENADDGI